MEDLSLLKNVIEEKERSKVTLTHFDSFPVVVTSAKGRTGAPWWRAAEGILITERILILERILMRQFPAEWRGFLVHIYISDNIGYAKPTYFAHTCRVLCSAQSFKVLQARLPATTS